jgi:hypothetical protein
MNPANEGKKNVEFDSLSKASSIRPIKAREMENFILNPKRHQSDQ